MTNFKIETSFNFLESCKKLNKKMWIRQVIVPNINDNEEYIDELASFIKTIPNVEKVELLPYHNKAIYKYEKLNIDYKLLNTPNMDIEKCQKLNKILLDKINF